MAKPSRKQFLNELRNLPRPQKGVFAHADHAWRENEVSRPLSRGLRLACLSFCFGRLLRADLDKSCAGDVRHGIRRSCVRWRSTPLSCWTWLYLGWIYMIGVQNTFKEVTNRRQTRAQVSHAGGVGLEPPSRSNSQFGSKAITLCSVHPTPPDFQDC